MATVILVVAPLACNIDVLLTHSSTSYAALDMFSALAPRVLHYSVNFHVC